MKKERVTSFLLLAISVSIIVPVWGTFHSIVGVSQAWIAFLSAAVYFAAGHKLKDSVNVSLSHLLGIGWGLAVLYLLANPIFEINGILYTFLILLFFGFMSVIITNIGIPIFSHTPSLFCGWAIAFAVFGGTPIADWIALDIEETMLACVIGVFFVGCGIAQLHAILLKYLFKNSSTLEDSQVIKETKSKNKITSKQNNQKSLAEEKMSKYLQEYSTPESKNAENKFEMQQLRTEISKLHQQLLDMPSGYSVNGNSSATKVKIIGICGSPHKKGSTIEYLRTAMNAAEEMGNVETEIIELAGKEIKPCLGCKSDRCGGTCIISDYMQELYPKLRECDGLILASPSYFGTFSGQIKLFIDRLRVMRHSNFELGNVVIGTLAVAGRRHGGQEITNLDLVQSMMRHNTIIVNDGTAVCQLGATGWSHTFDDPTKKADTDDYGMETAVGVGKRVAEIAKVIKSSGLQNTVYKYNQKIGKR